MQARGLLMIEHRLIERIISVIRNALTRIASEKKIDPAFIDMIVDFIYMYADRTHHGKEEDILFRDLGKRDISDKDRKLMNELVEEHILGRLMTQSIAKANNRYKDGHVAALGDIANGLQALTELYPGHIEKEDKVFFPAARAYLTDDEDKAMLAEFREFDQKMIHDKYRLLVQTLEGFS